MEQSGTDVQEGSGCGFSLKQKKKKKMPERFRDGLERLLLRWSHIYCDGTDKKQEIPAVFVQICMLARKPPTPRGRDL